MPRTDKKCKLQKQFLYTLVKRINNQTYFGITNNFNNRMKSHKNYTIDNNRKLYRDDTLHSKYPRWVPSKTGAPSDGKVYRVLPDGTKDIYLSASEAQTKLNINHVRRSIEKGWKSGGYHWYDLNPEECDTRGKRRPRYEGKVFRILEDGTRDEYTSSGEAKRILKITHIPRAIKTGMRAGGYNWYDVV